VRQVRRRWSLLHTKLEEAWLMARQGAIEAEYAQGG
jgi:hypothetical protein